MADQIDDQHGNQGAQETEQDNQQERCISLKMAESVNDRGGQCDIQKNECQNPVTGRVSENQFFETVSKKNDQDERKCLEKNGAHEIPAGILEFPYFNAFRYLRNSEIEFGDNRSMV